MSYLRGRYYIWADGERTHLWAEDGSDHWADSGWASDAHGKRHAGRENASGVSIPESVLDELDRKSTRLNSSHIQKSRMPSSA